MNNVTEQTSVEVTKHFHIRPLARCLNSLLAAAINHNSKTALRQNLNKAERQRYTRHQDTCSCLFIDVQGGNRAAAQGETYYYCCCCSDTTNTQQLCAAADVSKAVKLIN